MYSKNQRIAKGAGGKGPRQKRQKSSKSVKKFFDTFRQFSRRAKNVKNRQKVSKSFSTLFDNFRAAPFFRPLLQSAEKKNGRFRTPTPHPRNFTPGTKPIHAAKNSWGINFCENTCGACIHTHENTGNIFEGSFSAHSPNS